jgi:hypothetical protein
MRISLELRVLVIVERPLRLDHLLHERRQAPPAESVDRVLYVLPEVRGVARAVER